MVVNRTPPTQIPPPHCPHCDAVLEGVGMFQWAVEIYVIVSVYCPECQKTIHMQVIPNMQMLAQREDPRISIPH
jgi:hypothetical protein